MESIIEKFNDLQKEILSDFSLKWNPDKCKSTFRDDVKKFYGFEKEFGWNILLNAFYVIEDTEFAKQSFQKFGLQGPSRHLDIGERYLRFYGLLNAIYQQKLAVENLLELHKIKDKKAEINNLNNTDLVKIRNKVGAHPSNFLTDSKDAEHKFDVFELSRNYLSRGQIRLLRNQEHFEEYDLEKIIIAFNEVIESSFVKILSKVIKKLFQNQGKHYTQYQQIIEIMNGNILFNGKLVKFNDE